MRILQVHARYRQRGGEDVVVDAETSVLRAAGHEVVSFEAQNPTSVAASVGLLAKAPRNPAAARAIRRRISETRPDVVHVHNTWFALSPSVIEAAADAGVPVVMTLHNYRLLCANGLLFRDGGPCEDCVGTHPWHGVQHACYRGSRMQSVPAAATIALNRRLGTWHRHVAAFVALSPFARGRFLAGGLPAERLVVKPHFVDDPGPRAAPPSLGSEVLAVGRLAAGKGLEHLIDAWADARPQGLSLVLIGDGPERSALERRAGEGVVFLGACSKEIVRARMLAARALAFPSTAYETFGLSVIEALAAGLPVLASDRGGTPALLQDGAGWLVEPAEPMAWSAALRRLVDASVVDRSGRAARRRWQQHYSPAAGLRGLESLYGAVTAQGSAA